MQSLKNTLKCKWYLFHWELTKLRDEIVFLGVKEHCELRDVFINVGFRLLVMAPTVDGRWDPYTSLLSPFSFHN